MESVTFMDFDRDTVTVTADEATQMLRAAGLEICTETLRNGIQQGVFPFGVCIVLGKRNFYISRKKLVEWINDFCGCTAEEVTA